MRSEDGEALTEFAVFLTGCCNIVDSMEYIEEMDSRTNRTVMSKLPFKREAPLSSILRQRFQ